jgi:hypothetical protein
MKKIIALFLLLSVYTVSFAQIDTTMKNGWVPGAHSSGITYYYSDFNSLDKKEGDFSQNFYANGGNTDWIEIEKNITTVTRTTEEFTLWNKLTQLTPANGIVSATMTLSVKLNSGAWEEVGVIGVARSSLDTWIRHTFFESPEFLTQFNKLKIKITLSYSPGGQNIVFTTRCDYYHISSNAGMTFKAHIERFEQPISGIGIWNQNEIPEKFFLSQNYPNPFNPKTTIRFSIPKTSYIELKVYDVLGREVKTLVNENLNTGNHKVDFDGSKLESGTYFYRLIAGDFIKTKKMMLVK